jgi:hypothetical protein
MKLIQILENPVHGFWDGGAKQTFEWAIVGTPKKDAKGEFVRIGSVEANFWFHVSVGKTERATLSNARNYLARKTKVSCHFTIQN